MAISVFRFGGAWYERLPDGEIRRTSFTDLMRSDIVAGVIELIRGVKVKLVQPDAAKRYGWCEDLQQG